MEQLKLDLGKGTYKRPFAVKETASTFTVVDKNGELVCTVHKPCVYAYPHDSDALKAEKQVRAERLAEKKRLIAQFVADSLNSPVVLETPAI